eukprot:TRINITY_DN12259_c0_g2_i2.p1 TRINITY_DN12259_c0_g2~~TRINITY_DN12259_c0_g2_i2.p1  ORF type:complete len:475 (+),score=92.99 TRINITY_DN12259_c0_g2_i2:3-1427(+)
MIDTMSSSKNKSKGKSKQAKKGNNGAQQTITPPASLTRASVPVSDPRLFPAMKALQMCSNNADKKLLIDEYRREASLRIGNLLSAEWLPSTNKSFELLTGRHDRYTYYLYARHEKVVCQDLYGAFCVIHATATARGSSEVTAFVPLPKDVACYAYDLAAMMTQASYVLTFAASLGIPRSLIDPYQARIDKMLSFPELQRGELPNMERFSESLSDITFTTGVQILPLLRRAAELTESLPLQADALLGQEAFDLCLPALPDEQGFFNEISVTPNMSDELKQGVETYNTIVAASLVMEQEPCELKAFEHRCQAVWSSISLRILDGSVCCTAITSSRLLQWTDLDEALRELMEHFVMCGLSHASHLKMTHSVKPGPIDTIFTRNCVITTIIRSDGVMQPPPTSDALTKLIKENAPFEQFVLHAELDNEHTVDPELLRDYIRAQPLEEILETIDSAIAMYTNREATKDVFLLAKSAQSN